MEGKFDLKLIPEFDGSAAQSVVEWLGKLGLGFLLQMRILSSAFVYQIIYLFFQLNWWQF